MRVWHAAVVSVAVLAVTAAGCGSSGSSDRASFRRDANRICARFGRRANAIPFSTGHSASRAATILVEMNRRLRELKPPPADATRFKRFLAIQLEAARELRRLQEYIAANQPKAFRAMRQEKPRLRVPPAQALAHPTAAILSEEMSIPAVRRYVDGLNAFGRHDARTSREGDRLTRQLGLSSCR